jgi:hypothetical protein
MNIRVEGSEIKDKDTGKKVGTINGNDILTYPDGKKIGHKNGSDLFDKNGHKFGYYSNDSVVALFIKEM